MISTAMAKKVLGGAVGALTLAAGVARHVAWYVGHQVEASPRDAEPPARERR
jgi:hypothetical protein